MRLRYPIDQLLFASRTPARDRVDTRPLYRALDRNLERKEAGMETFPTCGYLSRVVELPMAIAEVLFDDATQSLGPATRAELPAIGTQLLPVRSVRTRLRASIPWPGVPVELQLTPWSRGRSEVAVRYGGNRRPGAIARHVYGNQAPRLLDDVTGEIQARIPGAVADRRAA